MAKTNIKRILSVTVEHEADTDGSSKIDYLGEYSNLRDSDYSIDRMHSQDCASVSSHEAIAVLVAKEELATLRTQLHAAGFSQRAITAAYRNVKAEEK